MVVSNEPAALLLGCFCLALLLAPRDEELLGEVGSAADVSQVRELIRGLVGASSTRGLRFFSRGLRFFSRGLRFFSRGL